MKVSQSVLAPLLAATVACQGGGASSAASFSAAPAGQISMAKLYSLASGADASFSSADRDKAIATLGQMKFSDVFSQLQQQEGSVVIGSYVFSSADMKARFNENSAAINAFASQYTDFAAYWRDSGYDMHRTMNEQQINATLESLQKALSTQAAPSAGLSLAALASNNSGNSNGNPGDASGGTQMPAQRPVTPRAQCDDQTSADAAWGFGSGGLGIFSLLFCPFCSLFFLGGAGFFGTKSVIDHTQCQRLGPDVSVSNGAGFTGPGGTPASDGSGASNINSY